MEKNLEVCFIIDKSDSMDHITKETIDGFNSVIEKKKRESDFDNIFVTTVLFNHKITLLHDRVDIKDVKKMTKRNYRTDGRTALYDAIGYAITRIDKQRAEMPKRNRPKYTMIIIITDGYENSSTEYSQSDILQMIDKKGEEGWEFVYLGANVDAIKESDKIGIGAYYSFNATREGVKNLYCDIITPVISSREFLPDELLGEESIRQKNAKKRAEKRADKRGESED